MARLRGVEYAVPLLVQAPKGARPNEWWRVQSPIPEDAEYVYCFVRPDGRSVVFVFRHESYQDVPEGDVIPVEDLIYESRIFDTAVDG